MSTITAGLLGCGTFSNDVYARLLEEFKGTLRLKAAWSRSESSSTSFVAQRAPQAVALHGDEGMQAVMLDASIDLVIVVLPPQAALQAVHAALAAGKHVIEEKPIGPSVQQALHAIQAYRISPPRGLWMIAENYRYEAVFLEAAQLVAGGSLGTIIKLDLVADMAMNTANRYYPSRWRRDVATCPGGQIMESSVHFIAALRLMARAAGMGEATQAVAFSRQVRSDLSPPDSMVGCVTFPAPPPSTRASDQQGTAAPVAASVSISMAAAQVRVSLSVVGTQGSLEVLRGGWGGNKAMYTLNLQTGNEPASSKQFGFSGTSREMGSFLHLIDSWPGPPEGHRTPAHPEENQPPSSSSLGTPADPLLSGPSSSLASLLARSSPEEGARDLAVVEALLESGRLGGQPVAVVPIPGPQI